MKKSLLFLAACCLGGCHTTTVSVTAEDPKAPPELIVQILDHPAGQVEVTNTSEKDWLLGKTHNTTRIQVPPGSKIVVMPSTQPIHPWLAASQPASGPSTRPAPVTPD